MKDYREVADNVFRRRDEYEAKKVARNLCLRRIGISLSVFFLCATFLFTASTCYVFAVGLGIVEDTFGISDRFFSVPITPKQQAVVEEAIVNLGSEVSCGGFSVTVKSAFTDGTTALVLVQVEAPKHIDLDAYDFHFKVDAKGIVRGDNPNKQLGATGLRISQIPMDDQDNARNTQDLLLRISQTKVLGYDYSFADGYDRYIKLDGMYAHEATYPFTEYQIAEGSWNFRIRFDDTYSHTEQEMLSEPITLSIKRAMYDVQQTATVHSIVVKGLSIVFRYSYSADAVNEPGDFGDVQVVLKDGTIIDARESTGSLGSNKGEFVNTYLSTSPILVDEIDYLRIGNGTIITNHEAHQGNPILPLPEE